MIFIYLLFINKLQAASSLCSKATYEGTEYTVESEEGKVQKQCKTRHIFNKEGVKYCLSKENSGRLSSVSCGKLKIPKAEIIAATLSKCSCDQSDNTNMEVEISGGQDETTPKWTVAITISKSANWPGDSVPPVKERTFCSGSLITHTTVLTAAHCMYAEYKMEKKFFPEKDVKVRPNSKGFAQVVVGMLNVNYLENTTAQEIEEFWVHPGYKPENFIEKWKTVGDNEFLRSVHQDDIAVIRLEKMDIKYYNPVCLPPLNDDPYADICVKISGWGRTRDPFNETDLDNTARLKPDTLQVLRTMTITNEECRTIFKDAKLYPLDWIVDLLLRDPITICHAGILGKSTCSGDSGGSMAIRIKENGKSTSYIIGVMSFGPPLIYGCGSKEPHVLTRVAHYVDWIRTKMEGEQPPRCGNYLSSDSCACC